MKKAYLYLVAVGVLSTLPVLFLFSGYYFRLETISYNFKRKISYPILSMRRFDLKYNSYYIAGHTGDKLYLGNTTAIRRLLIIDTLLTHTQSIELNASRIKLINAGHYRLLTDSNIFYLFNGIVPSIFLGKTYEWKLGKHPMLTPYFQEAVPIGGQSIVFRSVSSKTKMNSLRKESLFAEEAVNEGLFEKQVDGLFCTSGILDYNQQLKYLSYLYHYRNEILIVDTNLNLVRKIKTIDPIDTARFTVSTIKSNSSKVLTSSAVLVNVKCSSWKKYLFVQSKIMGQQEDEVRFKNSVVIDIYDLEKGRYLYSVYLPIQDKMTVSQFKVIDGFIYTMSDHFINRYEVTMPE